MHKVEALNTWQESQLFDDKERTVLAYAEAITAPGQQVDDTLFDQLRTHFNEEAIIELTGLIGYQYMSNIFNVALQIPSQGLCQIPLKN